MVIPDLAFGAEWTILELLTLGFSSHDMRLQFADLICSSDLNWAELLAQAKRHKLLPTLAVELAASEKAGEVRGEVIPSKVRQILSTALFRNRYKTSLYRQETAKIIAAIQRQGVRCVATKGMSLESTLYGGNGSRAFSDIDLMILPQDREMVRAIVLELGFQAGTFDPQKNCIIPHSRETLIKYKLSPDHLPSHIRLTDDAMIRFIELDIANSLTWTHCPFQIPVEDALAEIIFQPIPGIADVLLPCFTPQYQFIFTILHLFKEAWIELTVNMDKDVNLSKFGDVLRLWQMYGKELQTSNFVQYLEKYQAIDPIVWVLEHLDRTFNTDIVSVLGLLDRVSDNWLYSSGSGKGNLRYWRGTMRERLYCKTRQQLFI